MNHNILNLIVVTSTRLTGQLSAEVSLGLFQGQYFCHRL